MVRQQLDNWTFMKFVKKKKKKNYFLYVKLLKEVQKSDFGDDSVIYIYI